MRIVIQRSGKSSVSVNDKIVGEIEKGLVLLVCLEKEDTLETVKKAAQKILAMRLFEDENQKMNKSILDIGGQILAVSQFTLSWRGLKRKPPKL